ncbi:hypothetical protein O3M35_008002 [Rhynocoris fuscipes]|uniref:Uncharacterized protein n=1 Tax=Rhynocoris fuscipes TaxID=488301 RepID=A0AAW1DBB6_9HEMI
MRKIGLKRLDPWKLYKHHFHVTKGPVTVGLTLDKGVVMGLGNTTFQAARLNLTSSNVTSLSQLKTNYKILLRTNCCLLPFILDLAFNKLINDNWELFYDTIKEEVERYLTTSIQRCLRSEPQLDKCLLRAAKQAVPRFAKGIAEIGVEALDPLTGANFTLGSDTGPVALRVYADHVNITGPSKIQIKKIM